MYEPEVCYHLNQLGINPLKIAFPWMNFAFVGVLEIDQVLIFINVIDLPYMGQNTRI